MLGPCRSQAKEASADQKKPDGIKRTCHRHEGKAGGRQEEREDDVGQVEAMHHDAEVCGGLAEDLAAQHDDTDQHRSALRQESSQDGTGGVPDIGGHAGFSRSKELILCGVGGGGGVFVAQRDQGEGGRGGEHEGDADKG